MPALNTLRTVTIRQVSEGADKVRSDLDGLVSAHQRLAQASEQAATVTDMTSRRQLSAAAAYAKLSASIDPSVRAQQQLERSTRTLDRAFAQGAIDASAYEKTLGQLQARFNAVSATATQGASVHAANQNGRLRGDQVQNLGYQLSDVVSSLGSGSNLSTVALQQGPQIAQVFGGEGGASVRGAFDQAKEAVTGFIGRIGPVGAAIGAVTAVVGLGATALSSYASSQRELEKSLTGIGRASGVTVGQINALAPAAAAAAGVSVASAREMSGTFAATGLIGGEMYAGLIKQSRDYALMTGTDTAEASKTLAESFADPSKGALDLNKKLGFLNAEMLESIQTMQASGNRLGAQKLLMDGVASATADASTKLGFFARGWAEFSKNSSNEFNAVGGFISRGFGMDDAESRLKTLQGQLGARQSRMGTAGGLFDSIIGFDIDTIKADIAKVQAEIDKAAAANKKSGLGLRSLEIDGLAKGLNPTTAAMKDLAEKAENFRKYLKDEGGADPLGNYTRAMNGLNAQAKQFASDIAAGGSQFADAIRSAQFGLKTVGFSPTAQSAAQIDENAANQRLQALRSASTDTNLDTFNKQMQSIETARTLQLQTLTKQTTFDQNAVGGAFSRMAENIQAQIIAAATNPKYGQVTPALIAAIAQGESGGNANVGFSRSLGSDGRPSSAYGLGQITRGTAEDAVNRGYLPQGYDRTDTATMAQGIAAVLQMKIDQAGGNVDKGIMNYYGNPSEAANLSYLARVKRNMGEMGDPSVGALAKDQDALSRAQRDAGQNVENLTRYYGQNGRALELAQAQQAKYAELLDRGVPAQQAANIAYGDLIKKTVEFGQSAKMVQFASDNQFNRDQLGRSASDQSAYAQARSRIGDTSSPDAQRMIADIKETNNLVDAKNQASSALSGFAQDLAHGATAAQAASNALSRLADSVLNKVIDSLVSSAFGAAAKGGIGSLFGFADGGIMTSHGALPLHSYATGGIANSPQLALFGEGRGPEAFVPLPDGKRIPVAMSGPANMNSSGGAVSVNHAPTYNVTPASGVTPEQLAAVVDRNNRDFASRLPSLIKDADRRRA